MRNISKKKKFKLTVCLNLSYSSVSWPQQQQQPQQYWQQQQTTTTMTQTTTTAAITTAASTMASTILHEQSMGQTLRLSV